MSEHELARKISTAIGILLFFSPSIGLLWLTIHPQSLLAFGDWLKRKMNALFSGRGK